MTTLGVGRGRAARGSVTEGAARAGLTARGVIYLLVGALALQIAFGGSWSRRTARVRWQEIAEKPLGLRAAVGPGHRPGGHGAVAAVGGRVRRGGSGRPQVRPSGSRPPRASSSTPSSPTRC